VQVAKYYQSKAIEWHQEIRKADKERLIAWHKVTNTEDKIEATLKQYDVNNPPLEDTLCYLESALLEDYLHDMRICQNFADENRLAILLLICIYMGWDGSAIQPAFNVRHNYIDIKYGMVRKGAISAQKDETVFIPINMRDGAILGRGLGNPEYNYSAPHGAGRLMSRKAAKANIQISEVDEAMKDIYSTTYADAIDEAPQAYKPIESIVENIKDTVEIIDILKPLYNFKAGE
jgi:RNA-splicing ligase RtcB